MTNLKDRGLLRGQSGFSPTAVNPGFLDSSSFIFTWLSGLRSRPLLIRKFDSAGTRNRDFWDCSQGYAGSVIPGYTKTLNTILLCRMASSGMLRRVALVRTDVSEELSASIISVTRISEVGKLAVTSNRRTL
jgi:hypothetical protein